MAFYVLIHYHNLEQVERLVLSVWLGPTGLDWVTADSDAYHAPLYAAKILMPSEWIHYIRPLFTC